MKTMFGCVTRLNSNVVGELKSLSRKHSREQGANRKSETLGKGVS